MLDVRTQGSCEGLGAVAGSVIGERGLDGDSVGGENAAARIQKAAAVSFFSSSRISE